MDRSLYLLWLGRSAGQPDHLDFHGDAAPLADDLWLVRSHLSRSQIYHRIKWQLPEGAALLVAPLADDPAGWPKFKGMAKGALRWLKDG